MGTVYLIHFDKPLCHARHYLGFTSLDLDERIQRHRNGRGARLLAAITENGITWRVVRTWKGEPDLERQLKRQKNSKRFCPICSNL